MTIPPPFSDYASPLWCWNCNSWHHPGPCPTSVPPHIENVTCTYTGGPEEKLLEAKRLIEEALEQIKGGKR